MSLRVRITVWVLALFISLQVTTAFVFWIFQRTSLIAMFNRNMELRVEPLIEIVKPRASTLSHSEFNRIVREELSNVQFASFRTTLFNAQGTAPEDCPDTWPNAVGSAVTAAIKTRHPSFINIDVDWFTQDFDKASSARVLTYPFTDDLGNDWAIVLARNDVRLKQQQDLLARSILVSGLIGFAATMASAWYVAGIAVKPLQHAREWAERLNPHALSETYSSKSAAKEVQELSQALDEARERIRKTLEAQERFLSNISHEIKTPIATLLVEAQTIDKASLSKPGTQFVRSVEEETRRLGKLVESFLTLTRVQDGKGIARLEIVPINELVLDSVAHCSAMARQYAVRLDAQLADDFEHIDAAIAGDPDLLRTMLDNLVRNAIRFSPQSGVVAITSAVENGRAKITVVDEGPGLPVYLLSNAFDRFVQATEEQRKGRGHGLGLTIAQAVAELHGGAISVCNMDKGGACFSISLPLRQS